MMGAEQLTLLEPVDEKLVRKVVIKELKEYRALKVQVENKEEREHAGLELFPSIRNSHHINKLKVKQIDRALKNSLDQEELLIIEKAYLTSKRTKDIEIYLEIGVKKDTYYAMRNRALNRLATALGII